MVGRDQVDPQGGRLERDKHDGDVGAVGEVGDGRLPRRHAHAAVQPPELEPA